MRIAEASILCIGVLVASAAHGAEDVERKARPKFETSRDACYVGEYVTLTLRIEADTQWLREHALQTSRRTLDVPIAVAAPGMQGVPGVFELLPDAASEPARPRRTLALDDAAVSAATDGEDLVVTRRFVAKRAGPVTLAAPAVRFEYSERFEDDLVHGRVPVERRTASAEGEPLSLTIFELPREGRPPAFSGGIGRFDVTATADRPDVTVGEHLTLRLVITGDGNLDALDPPRLDDLADFHVFGMLDDKGAPTRIVTYDLSPLKPSGREIPPIALHYFDPWPPAQYRTARSASVALTVSGLEGTPGETSPPTDAPKRRRNNTFFVVGMLVVVIVAVAARRRRAAARRAALDAAGMRGADAAAEFRRTSASPGANLADAFAAYLAARLCCAPAAVIAADLPERLAAAGVSHDVAGRTSALVERLVATRYGGGADESAAADARSLVDELERALTPPR